MLKVKDCRLDTDSRPTPNEVYEVAYWLDAAVSTLESLEDASIGPQKTGEVLWGIRKTLRLCSDVLKVGNDHLWNKQAWGDVDLPKEETRRRKSE